VARLPELAKRFPPTRKTGLAVDTQNLVSAARDLDRAPPGVAGASRALSTEASNLPLA
jgi:hypothetical protein